MNVLLVDDEPLVIQDIAASIHWSSIGVRHVLLAYSASQAMEKFEEYDIGLIICDVEMPHINGLQLLAWVKEHSPNTRSIILTCHPLFDYAKEAIHLNCIDYILKPIDTDALEELLKKSVGELLRTSPLRTQEVFWKNCAEGAYPDASSLPAVAKQYGISSETAAYVTVSIYFTNLEKRCLDDSGMYQSLLTAVSGSFSDTEFHHLFFLDNTHTIFGIFSAAPEELAPLAASICHRLEAQRYFMPWCITALIQESTDIPTAVRSFSLLRSIARQSGSSRIRIISRGTGASKTRLLLPDSPYPKLDEEVLLQAIRQQLSSISPEPTRHQETLIALRRELEDWFFTVLACQDISPAEAMPQQKIHALRGNAITGSEAFLTWAQQLLAQLNHELRQYQQSRLTVNKARNYIDHNLQLNLSRKEVASQVFLNADYLDRCFRNELGLSISQYVLQQKLELAKDLLLHTSKSISDIAAAVGYGNLSSFSYMFKHETGETPLSFRRK